MTAEEFDRFEKLVGAILTGCVVGSITLLVIAIIIVTFYPNMW